MNLATFHDEIKFASLMIIDLSAKHRAVCIKDQAPWDILFPS